MNRFGGLTHLARRFWGSLRSRYPRPERQRSLGSLLSLDEAGLFWSQDPADLRHALSVAGIVEQARPGRPDLVRAALLHDVGKVEAGIGPLRRSLATVLAVTRLPRTARLQAYLDHPALGARRLEGIAAEPLVVAFARHHRSAEPPQGVDPDDWAVLRQADAEA